MDAATSSANAQASDGCEYNNQCVDFHSLEGCDIFALQSIRWIIALFKIEWTAAFLRIVFF